MIIKLQGKKNLTKEEKTGSQKIISPTMGLEPTIS